MASSSNTYEVNVTFNPAPRGEQRAFSYSGDQVKYETEELVVFPGIRIHHGDTAMINFTLLTVNNPSGGAAIFTAPAVEWTTNGAPPSTTVAEVSPQILSMVVPNNNGTTADEKYGFKLQVSCGGVTYISPDPTIINEPPGPPTC